MPTDIQGPAPLLVSSAPRLVPRSPPRFPAPLTQDASDPQRQLLQVRLAAAQQRGRRLLHGSRPRSARGQGSGGDPAGEPGGSEGWTPPRSLGRHVHGMPGVVVLSAWERGGAEMGGPGCSGSSSSVGRSFPRARRVLHTKPPGHSDSSTRCFQPRRGRPRKRGRASAPCSQWGLGLEAGAERPQRYAPSGGCFKMADVAGPSRPGAAAFWSRDCILCPPGRAVAWDPEWRGVARCASWGGVVLFGHRPGAGLSSGVGIRRQSAWSVPRLALQVWGFSTDVSQPSELWKDGLESWPSLGLGGSLCPWWPQADSVCAEWAYGGGKGFGWRGSRFVLGLGVPLVCVVRGKSGPCETSKACQWWFIFILGFFGEVWGLVSLGYDRFVLANRIRCKSSGLGVMLIYMLIAGYYWQDWSSWIVLG